MGETASAEFGFSVATAGDVNGDGYADVVVGARFDSSLAEGKAYLYLGGAGGLAVSSSWSAVGETASAEFGFSVATAGDVNGDGYADVVVGARFNSSLAGKAYLYLGGAGGLAVSSSWSAVGEAANAEFGFSVATAGDVNGDGYSDVVIGARGSSNYTGKAYLYLGGASGLTTGPSWTAVGEATNNYFGHFIATAGDVNGDGYADVIAGAWANTGSTGKAYLYLGGTSSLTGSSVWSTPGEVASDRYGYSVSTAGDVNGDGYADVVVGAYRNASATGKAYLYLGGSNGLSTSTSWTAVGEVTFNYFGYSVAPAGDVNGDGYSDVVIGAYYHDGLKGKAYLYLGGASGLATGASWTGVGEAADDRYGISVSSAGDTNGDGYADVVVGAHNYASGTGKAYLYLGGLSGLSTSASWTAQGEATGNFFGRSVSAAGDVNGDGYGDLVAGAYGNSSSTGKVYLYLGGGGSLATSAAWTAAGEVASDLFGYSVGTAGDANGDGYADVVVGAYGKSSFTGKAYLYLGGVGGLPMSASWTAVGETVNDYFAQAVATAGDVNGDGYSDVVVGAYRKTSSTGKAYLYLGGAGGLATGAAWTAVGEATGALFGYSVAAAGDVNGDGSADVVIGAYRINGSMGKSYLYFGGGGAGVPLVPRQLRADLSAPISLGGSAFEQQFRLGLTLRSPVGRVARQLQWQVAPWDGYFTPALNPIQSEPTWHSRPRAVSELLTLPDPLERYIWRARVKYHPAQSPFVLWSPWVTLSGNGLYETDILSRSQAAPPPCVAPDEVLYITLVTLDGNGKPVIHYQDPNQTTAVTGYNVYRAATAGGPWVLLGSDVLDMDAGTPNNQYVDLTGDVGGPWFYKVVAYNNSCGAEGP